MRKLLLNSTAIATVAALTSGVALADVSISAATEWAYNSRSSQIVAKDGTTFGNVSEILFKFSNKTDSGLTIGYTVDLVSDAGAAGNATIDESSLSISGGFGTVILGQNDNAAEDFGIGAKDILAEEQTPMSASAAIGSNADIAVEDGDDNKIQYKLPAMGGLTIGASYADSGESPTIATSTDTTAFGARYALTAGETAVTIGLATATTEAPTTDKDAQNMGIKVVNGNITFALSQSEESSANDDINNMAVAVSYKMANGMTIGAYSFKSEDDLDIAEEYTSSGVELQYTVAAGLTAVINVDDYEYTAATTDVAGVGGALADSGTNSRLTLKASF
jgi:predicted porin